MPKRICKKPGCNTLIDKPQVYCEEHRHIQEQYKRERYKVYDHYRKDDKEYKFYKKQEWRNKRESILKKFGGIDIYEYFINKRIVKADTVHHIIELKESWDKRYDDDNLIPVSKENHQLIHIIYRKSEEDKKELQMMLSNYLEQFGISPP